MDPKILELIRVDSRYAYEAYEFVCDAVTFTQEQLDRIPAEEDDPDTDYHVSGEELIRGACELANLEFGMMATVVFRQWGIRKTDDFGNIVFNLIRVERLSKSERDDLEDFRELFDLEKVLAEGFELTAGDATNPWKGDR
ncbi:Minf_1886 family protein [Fimbriiglobus ruber]|uniref:Uncharacterized protein n=1 Tax=Fimbriiglobus ruber TaxID=1908690 RepID=A0A225DF23_9BACT|nr:Minf_1886 family protein [Fimbriiglobus ruber]OWK35936.1 hypothetical protein FRUB_08499 [Fimbriiglobus ruber]